MSDYEKVFERPYPDGWKDKPEESTGISASALNKYDAAFEHIEEYLTNMPQYATEDYVNNALGNILEGSS